MKQDIRQVLEQKMREFRQAVPLSSFGDDAFYRNWLSQTYFFVCHSVPLLGHAAAHARDKAFQQRLLDHIGEESRHDLVALKDMEGLNDSVANYVEHPLTQAFYQSQYYRIQFQGSEALMGYILYLESMAMNIGPEGLGHAQRAFGAKACKFLKVHVEEDVDHVEKAVSQVEKFGPEQKAWILENIEFTAHVYRTIMSEAARGRQTNWKKAA